MTIENAIVCVLLFIVAPILFVLFRGFRKVTMWVLILLGLLATVAISQYGGWYQDKGWPFGLFFWIPALFIWEGINTEEYNELMRKKGRRKDE